MKRKKSKRELLVLRLALSFIVVFLGFALSAQAAMIDYQEVKLQVLDKSMARTVTLKAKVGSTIEYGSMFIKIQACRKSEPLDKPESASFLQIWEVPINSDKSEWLFSGWMFASSPALSAMNHPVYDVWVLDCIDKDNKKNTATKNEEGLKSELETKEMAEPKKFKSTLTPKITIEEDNDTDASPPTIIPQALDIKENSEDLPLNFE